VAKWTELVVGREFRVPGSISNFGPGFDALSMAVQLFLRVRVVDVKTRSPGTLSCDFGEGPVPGENRIESAFCRAQETFGVAPRAIRVTVDSEIPYRAGLGSSGAATVAGLRLYEAVTAPRSPDEWLPLACELEGHPDNAAAALLGGMTSSCQHENGRVTARSWPWPAGVQLVVATPHVEVATADARRVLPRDIPMRDAVYNLQHAVLLLHAFGSGNCADFGAALRDRWHQPFRARLVPGLAEALTLEHPSLLGVSLSGAGPSVVAFTAGGEREIVRLLEDVYRSLNVPCTVRPVAPQPPLGDPAAPTASRPTGNPG
jgi:homoserine kinase